ncbi:Uncharacterised protein [Mycobacteroides abscessus subsp. abscessus]|nr:Uncharacterised protein [Mycobacteroides abscessus subsp. abscessus]
MGLGIVPCLIHTLTGAITNAVISRHTHSPGKIRKQRAVKYVFGLGCRIQLDVIRNPDTAKNPSTPTWESS